MSRPRPLETSSHPETASESTTTGAREKRAADGSAAASGMRRAVGFGNYRLFARLGSGGMADVYLAVAQGAMNVNRLVVIKRLRDEHASDPGSREMFLNEARLAARLNHPNVIQTFEAGSEGGGFFLAMEYVDGQPLSRILTAFKREGKILEPRIAARICSDALSGLHYAHELKDFDGSPLEIVHRDVSPQNVMLTYEGAVKLVDFGIAKAAGTAQTAHGIFKGKVAFMAPEQVRAENVDRRADLFAMGIVLWESVTGKHLMAESTPAATLYNLMTKEIPRASSVNDAVPSALDDIIDRALRRDVTERYQTAKEMRDELQAFIASAGGVTSEELGELTKALFADTRAKVQAQIKAQLATLSFGRVAESGRHTPLEVPLSQTQVRQMTHGLVALDDGFVEASSKASVFRVVTTQGELPQSTRRLALVAWFCIPLLALAASALALMRSQRAPAPEEQHAASSPPPAVTTIFEPAPPAPAPTPVAAETATASASAVSRPQVTAPPPQAPRQVWSPPPRPTPPPAAPQATTSATASEAPRSTSSAPPPKPQDPPQGRTFRRDL